MSKARQTHVEVQSTCGRLVDCIASVKLEKAVQVRGRSRVPVRLHLSLLEGQIKNERRLGYSSYELVAASLTLDQTERVAEKKS